MARAIAWITGRTGRWAVIAAWIAAAAMCVIAASKLSEVMAVGQTSYLPAHAESTEVVDDLQQGPGGGANVAALVVFSREEGLTREDRKAIGRIGGRLRRLGLDGSTPVLDPLSESGKQTELDRGAEGFLGKAGLVSNNGKAAIITLGINADVRDALSDDVNAIRTLLREDVPQGLAAHVTGPAGVAVDLQQVAEDAGRTLLIAATGLILILLLAVYRAPVLAVLPLPVVAAAYFVTSGIGYLLIKAGIFEVNQQSTLLVLVLIFGAGTDYALLLVNRYREELTGDPDMTAALRRAAVASAPTLAASGATVMAAMLALLLADVLSTRWLGPLLALGIGVMLLAAFTLLPAALSVLGRHAFWGARRQLDDDSPGVWYGLADLVRRRTRLLIVVIVAGLVIAALGNVVKSDTLGFGQGVTKPTDSSEGTAIVDANFADGLNAPVMVLANPDSLEQVRSAVDRRSDAVLALPAPERLESGFVPLVVVLREDPYSDEGDEAIESMRSELPRVDPGVLVGGVTAENVDVEESTSRDTRVIVPVVLAVVFLILAGLLRAIVAPIYLIGTVILSYGAALGITKVLFVDVLDSEGIAFDLPLMAFIFLVALGIDYNIFLMRRARDEARTLGTKDGMLRSLMTTGVVVTSAGVILAGTFATLTLLPLEAVVQIGATVAIGVLLDTFVVRSLLVPSITYALGDRAWWPGRG